MTKIQTLTNDAQLTDSQGWAYRDDEHRPSSTIPQIMNLLYKTELEEELDWNEQLKLAVYIDNVAAFDDLTPDRIIELYWESVENFHGEHSSEAEFAENFLTEVGLVDEDAIANLVIDWQGTYNYSLQYDYFNISVIAKNDASNSFEIMRFFWRNA